MKKWDESAERYNPNFKLRFSTVVSCGNIEELPWIVRLAGQFKHIDSVYFQPIVLNKDQRHLRYLSLDNISGEKIEKVVKEIEDESKKANVSIDGLNNIKAIKVKEDAIHNEDKDLDYSKANGCRYAWNGILSLSQTGELRYFCCYMKNDCIQKVLELYPVKKEKLLTKSYNCRNYWRFRRDMLDGKLIEYCKSCPFAEIGHNNLTSKEVDLNESIYV